VREDVAERERNYAHGGVYVFPGKNPVKNSHSQATSPSFIKISRWRFLALPWVALPL